MKQVEAKAKTRQEAIQKALSELGAELHEVEIEILDEGSKGLFGIGARAVHVKVKAEHIPDDKPRREERGRKEGREPRRERKPRPEREPRKEWPQEERRPKPEARDKDAEPRGRDQKAEEAPSAEPTDRPKRPRGRARTRGGRGRGRTRSREQQARTDAERKEARPREDRPRSGEGRGRRQESSAGADDRRDSEGRRERRERPTEQRAPREQREHAPRQRRERTEPVDMEKAQAMAHSGAATLQEIVEKMGMEGTVTSSVSEDGEILLHIDSPDSAILIGRKGSTLHALQFIMNRILLQGDDSDTAERVIVDVERYRERRRESLEEMARDMAAKAKETGRTMRVKPLSPQERRIVHLALEGDQGVRTYSLGSSALRRVVIVPTDGDSGNGTEHDEEADEVHENVESDVES